MDLNNPDVSILVEVIHHSIGVSLVPNYIKLHKFNMLKLQESGYKPPVPRKVTGGTAAADVAKDATTKVQNN